jgi:hypothetical protein
LPELDVNTSFPQRFETGTHIVVQQRNDTDVYFLYHDRKNLAVFFGASPFAAKPPGLSTLNGNKPEQALQTLVNNGFFEISRSLAEAHADRLHEQAASNPSLKPVAESLAAFARSLPLDLAPSDNRRYAGRINPETLELALRPAIDATPDWMLLRRLSPRRAVRRYFHLPSLQTDLAEDPEAALADVRLAAALLADQNYEANCWLFDHHQALCESHGLSFSD